MKNIIQDATEKARAKRLAFVVAQHEKGLTQVQIAQKLGVSKQRVSILFKQAGLK